MSKINIPPRWSVALSHAGLGDARAIRLAIERAHDVASPLIGGDILSPFDTAVLTAAHALARSAAERPVSINAVSSAVSLNGPAVCFVFDSLGSKRVPLANAVQRDGKAGNSGATVSLTAAGIGVAEAILGTVKQVAPVAQAQPATVKRNRVRRK